MSSFCSRLRTGDASLPFRLVSKLTPRSPFFITQVRQDHWIQGSLLHTLYLLVSSSRTDATVSPFLFVRSQTKEAYLANTLPTIYPWLPDVKALLEQQDAMLVTTYARVVVGGDKELAGRQLGSQLREKVRPFFSSSSPSPSSLLSNPLSLPPS